MGDILLYRLEVCGCKGEILADIMPRVLNEYEEHDQTNTIHLQQGQRIVAARLDHSYNIPVLIAFILYDYIWEL